VPETYVNKLSKFNLWITASRPKTLPAAVTPVIVGSAIAGFEHKFNLVPALFALVISLLIQIATNFVNDLYDYLKGTDKPDRVGPQRLLTSGLISPQEMKLAIYITFGLAFLLGLYLVYLGGWIVLLIGVLSIAAGINYTAGPFPFAYNGLGDLFVFIFFGIVATVGTYFVQALSFSSLALWASVPVGLLITNILVVNNYRDADEDKLAEKKTLAVRFGKSFARGQYLVSVIISYAILFVIYFEYQTTAWIFLPLLSLPLAVKLVRMIYTLTGSPLNETLALTGIFSTLYGLLFAIGLLL
jgi:1,4-dihydroxy-2-naphthoate octaprenyltransferase